MKDHKLLKKAFMDIYCGKIKVKLNEKEKRLAKKLEVELTKKIRGGAPPLIQQIFRRKYYDEKIKMRAIIKALIEKYKPKTDGNKSEDIRPQDCSLITSYPQYEGTCWFNVVIMSIFYSQYSRPLIIKNMHHLKSKSELLYDIFSYVIFYNFLKDENYELGDMYKPEDILRALRDYDKNQFIFNPNLNSGYDGGLYQHNLYKLFNINILSLDINIRYNLISYSLRNNNDSLADIPKEKIQSAAFISNPDILILSSLDSKYLSGNKYYLDTEKANKILKFKKEIIFNNNVYILDSITKTNIYRPKQKSGHAIAGITCNNERYIYNGWLNKIRNKDTTCPLLKFNWDPLIEQKFILNKDNNGCKDIIKLNYNKSNEDESSLEFSFGEKIKRRISYIKLEKSKDITDRYTKIFNEIEKKLNDFVIEAEVAKAKEFTLDYEKYTDLIEILNCFNNKEEYLINPTIESKYNKCKIIMKDGINCKDNQEYSLIKTKCIDKCKSDQLRDKIREECIDKTTIDNILKMTLIKSNKRIELQNKINTGIEEYKKLSNRIDKYEKMFDIHANIILYNDVLKPEKDNIYYLETFDIIKFWEQEDFIKSIDYLTILKKEIDANDKIFEDVINGRREKNINLAKSITDNRIFELYSIFTWNKNIKNIDDVINAINKYKIVLKETQDIFKEYSTIISKSKKYNESDSKKIKDLNEFILKLKNNENIIKIKQIEEEVLKNKSLITSKETERTKHIDTIKEKAKKEQTEYRRKKLDDLIGKVNLFTDKKNTAEQNLDMQIKIFQNEDNINNALNINNARIQFATALNDESKAYKEYIKFTTEYEVAPEIEINSKEYNINKINIANELIRKYEKYTKTPQPTRQVPQPTRQVQQVPQVPQQILYNGYNPQYVQGPPAPRLKNSGWTGGDKRKRKNNKKKK